jgi:serine/threonine protein kinase
MKRRTLDMPDDKHDVATDSIDRLIERGEHAAAAQLAVASGEWGRAIALYRLLWRYADALPLALRLGDLALAVELALDARRGDEARAIARRIPAENAAELGRGALAFAAHGEHWEAGQLAERGHDWDGAAAHYRRAGSHLDAGRMDDRAGRAREAGLAYERALAVASDERAAARAHEALGRLLGRMGQHHEAARSLQQAMRIPGQRLSAARALVAELGALGLTVASAEIAARIQREFPDQPATPEAIVARDIAEQALETTAGSQFSTETGLHRRRFRILRLLGAGATSQVYWATDTLLGHDVALKLLTIGSTTSAVGAERVAYQRFAREAEAVGRLRHPNIVGLFDADAAAGMFVLERMPGGTLAERLANHGALPPRLVRRLALDLLSALAAAHGHGLVHRDVKPANILFDEAGNAKLADFGAAHLADFGQTQTGGLMGTLAYMSPEQISGANIGPRADLYAAGVTLFEALTGRLPFLGPDIVAQHLGDAAPRPSDVGTGATALLPCHDAALLRALEKAPQQRWSSADEMAEAIRGWPSDDGAVARRAAPSPQAPSAEPPADAEPHQAENISVIGRSAYGILSVRDDLRLNRAVLFEQRTIAIDASPEHLHQVRNLAAAGGPFVQRVLSISEDGTQVTYEWIEGPRVELPDVPIEWRAPLLAAWQSLVAEGILSPADAPPIILTTAGPVLILCHPH